MTPDRAPPPDPLQRAAGDDARRGFIRQSLGSVLIKGASVLIGFLIVVVLARVLGKDGYGVYAVVFATVSVLSIPAALGAPALMVRETARAREAGEDDTMPELWRKADLFVLSCCAAVVLATGAWLVLGDMGETYRWAFAAALVLIPLRAFIALRGAMLRGLGKVLLGQVPEFVLRPGLFLLLVVVWAAAGLFGAFSASQALLLHGAAGVLALGAGIVLLRRHAPSRTAGAGASPMAMRPMLVASATMGLVAGAQVLNSNLDVIMLGALADPDAAGVYKVAASTALLASFGLQAVNQVLMPRVAASHRRQDQDTMRGLIRQSARLSALLAGAAALVLCAAGAWFLEAAFGAGYQAGYAALVILVLGQLANTLFGPVISVLNMTGHERDTLMGVLIACAVNVVLNALLIPPYGIEGAAIATVTTLLCWNAILFLRVRQRLGINASAFGRAP